jgi:hypothetical protein
MNLKHVKDCARVLFRACIPLFLFGGHGLGKTSIFYQLWIELAREFGYNPLVMHDQISSVDGKSLVRNKQDLDAFGLWSMSAANVTTEELIGMPHIQDMGAIYREVWLETLRAASNVASNVESVKVAHQQLFAYACEELGLTEDDRGQLVLRYLRMHSFIPDPRHRGGGVWIIDEANLAFIEVEKALMQMFLEKRYLDYRLPDNIWIVTTMNPPCSSYPGARDLALTTLDRGAMLTVDSDKDEWAKWATKRGLSEASRLFVDRHDSALLNPVEKEFKLDEFRNPATYRSIELVDRAYAKMRDNEIEGVGLSVATSLLGPDAAAVWHREYTERVHRPLSLTDVIDGYGWREDMTEDEQRDFETWEVTKSRTRLRAMIRRENVKTELVRFTLGELGEWIEKLDKECRERKGTEDDPKLTHLEKGQILNFLLFLHDLPTDIARAFWIDDVGNRYEIAIFWSGKHPVSRSFYARIETGYRKAEKHDDTAIEAKSA